jgi:cell division protein FtsL
MAKKRAVGKRPAGGWSARGVLALVLVGFVAVASVVILRRVIGVKQQTEITGLEQQRAALEADRIRIEGEIRAASSRQRLEPIAEQRLNMHIATPQEQVILPPLPRPGRPINPPHDSL